MINSRVSTQPTPWTGSRCLRVLGSHAIVLATLGGLAACGGGTGITGCDLCTSSALVYGTVTSADGSPVPAAMVTASGWRLGCPGEGGKGPFFDSPDLATDESGEFRTVVTALLGPELMCLVVRADPSADSGLLPMADTGATVMLTPDFNRAEPMDSVRVDLVLPRGP